MKLKFQTLILARLQRKAQIIISIASNKLDLKNNKHIFQNEFLHAQDNEYRSMTNEKVHTIDSCRPSKYVYMTAEETKSFVKKILKVHVFSCVDLLCDDFL